MTIGISPPPPLRRTASPRHRVIYGQLIDDARYFSYREDMTPPHSFLIAVPALSLIAI